MSKVVTLSAAVSAPVVFKEMIDKLAAKDPQFAALIQEMDTREIIAECVKSAVDALCANHADITRAPAVLDYYQKAFAGKFHKIIKSRAFSRGIGISVDEKTGTINFSADDYQHQSEVKRLKDLFHQYFIQEALKAVLEILGYNIEASREVVKDANTGAEKVMLSLCAGKER
ncbi:hypothetical protein HZB94_01875 [Candidatus Falkowbacteria bacterium]|nr:hypothetical protein [Candidatus Falkowbacteria bacterium]